jgi:hypothetical protein
MNIVIKALAIGFIFLPQLVKAQQIKPPNTAPLTDTLKQTAQQLQPKPTLGKYDYYKSLGIACKAELKLEKTTNIPFRFRLGSLQQTDYLEGKPNAQKPESK